MADPTMQLMTEFEQPDKWDSVKENVPIFVEHACYVVQGPDGKKKQVIVFPGEDPPEGGELAYTIDAAALGRVAGTINKNLAEYGKPIKIFVGHTKDPTRAAQTEQPVLVGYGRGATVGRWGPKGQLGVLTRQYIRKGCLNLAREYPERSPEFYPGRDEITALALLKTDPRLPMGMVTYKRRDGAVLYARGFDMADERDDDTPAETTEPAAPEAPAEPQAAANDLELSPDEANTAMRYMAHYERHHPVMKHMCAKYAEAQAPVGVPAAASGTNGFPPAEADKPKEPTQMSREEQPVNYQALSDRIAKVEAVNTRLVEENAKLKAEKVVGRLVAKGKKIPDVGDEVKRMSRLDDAGRADREKEIMQCYADDERPPVGGDVDLFDTTGPAEGGTPETRFTAEDSHDAVHYCEEHGLDAADDRQWKKAMAAVLDEKKKAGKR